MLSLDEINDYIHQHHYRQINSLILYQDGEMIEKYYNGYNEISRNMIKSIAKSITSICVGICLDKGLMKDLDEPIYKYLSEFDQGMDPLHRAITIRHLLTMTSGIYWNGGVHYHCPMLEQLRRSNDWIAHIADVVVTSVPGTKYSYKEWDIILLAAVIEKVVGYDMFDFLNENLYEPLGIQSDHWWKSKCRVTYSVADGDENESTSNLTARELLSIGKLFLYNGIVNGRRILSEEYISQAIAPSKCNLGYGFMWWLGEDWYGCRGYGGQNISVFPNKNTIFVMQATPTSRGMGYDDVFMYLRGKI